MKDGAGVVSVRVGVGVFVFFFVYVCGLANNGSEAQMCTTAAAETKDNNEARATSSAERCRSMCIGTPETNGRCRSFVSRHDENASKRPQ